jgi:hypothetical protein
MKHHLTHDKTSSSSSTSIPVSDQGEILFIPQIPLKANRYAEPLSATDPTQPSNYLGLEIGSFFFPQWRAARPSRETVDISRGRNKVQPRQRQPLN